MRDECEPLGAAGGRRRRRPRRTCWCRGDRARRPARPGAGDPVAAPGPATSSPYTGRLGWSAAGLAVLGARASARRVRLVEAHRRPEPPYAAGPAAAELGATAMVDVSDGLVADLGHIAVASEVGIELDTSGGCDVPAQMRDVGQAVGVEPMDWVLAGGEDHALAATFPGDVTLPAPLEGDRRGRPAAAGWSWTARA